MTQWIIGFYYIRRVSVRDVKHVHGSYHALHSHEYVLIDEFDKTPFVLVRITGTVNDAHLLDEGRFSRLSRTWSHPITQEKENKTTKKVMIKILNQIMHM